jgi:hypothetical protein
MDKDRVGNESDPERGGEHLPRMDAGARSIAVMTSIEFDGFRSTERGDQAER